MNARKSLLLLMEQKVSVKVLNLTRALFQGTVFFRQHESYIENTHVSEISVCHTVE